MRRRALAAILFGSVLVACGGGDSEPHGPDPSLVAGTGVYTFHWEPEQPAAQAADREYLLFLPSTYLEGSGSPLPLIVFLHGYAVEAVDDPDEVRRRSGILSAAEELDAAGLLDDAGFAVLVPVATWSDYTQPTWPAELIDALLTHVEGLIEVDPDRVYLTGHSWGASGVLAFARAHPDVPAAVVTFSGGWQSPTLPPDLCTISGIPTRMYHGTADTETPRSRSEQVAAALAACGGEPELVLLQEVDHDSHLVVFSGPEFYGWLLGQER